MQRVAAAVLAVLLLVSAAPRKPSPAAPESVPHPIAQFLRELSRDGARTVTFKATAVGTRFYFEEPAGVTIYRFQKGAYVKEQFLRATTLAQALKKR
ncbi:MAG TPA: hypothetical protein VF824_16990 [Thermoanaerobaculia bacterium]|jgi:hypothetical protein